MNSLYRWHPGSRAGRGRDRPRATLPNGPKDTAMAATLDTPTVPARQQLRQAILRHVTYSLGSTLEELSPREKFFAVALAVRDLMVDAMLQTEKRYDQADAKRVYYL